ncbi:MAG TPA: hypothetical protein VGQ87_02805 [Patescibacteria group bacterium]|jgi:hypothetical protein|nr:hypothetical protein [Patescibacteria group bacterium]
MSPINILLQGFIAVILIGVFYNVWLTSKSYGGLIGHAIRYLGFGLLFVTLGVIEKILVTFQVIEFTINLSMLQDALTLIGLIFLALGFSKLASIAKS